MVDHVLAAGTRSTGTPAVTPAPARPAMDTLQPEDLQPAWRGAGKR
jgi:hypothetical protein